MEEYEQIYFSSEFGSDDELLNDEVILETNQEQKTITAGKMEVRKQMEGHHQNNTIIVNNQTTKSATTVEHRTISWSLNLNQTVKASSSEKEYIKSENNEDIENEHKVVDPRMLPHTCNTTCPCMKELHKPAIACSAISKNTNERNHSGLREWVPLDARQKNLGKEVVRCHNIDIQLVKDKLILSQVPCSKDDVIAKIPGDGKPSVLREWVPFDARHKNLGKEVSRYNVDSQLVKDTIISSKVPLHKEDVIAKKAGDVIAKNMCKKPKNGSVNIEQLAKQPPVSKPENTPEKVSVIKKLINTSNIPKQPLVPKQLKENIEILKGRPDTKKIPKLLVTTTIPRTRIKNLVKAAPLRVNTKIDLNFKTVFKPIPKPDDLKDTGANLDLNQREVNKNNSSEPIPKPDEAKINLNTRRTEVKRNPDYCKETDASQKMLDIYLQTGSAFDLSEAMINKFFSQYGFVDEVKFSSIKGSVLFQNPSIAKNLLHQEFKVGHCTIYSTGPLDNHTENPVKTQILLEAKDLPTEKFIVLRNHFEEFGEVAGIFYIEPTKEGMMRAIVGFKKEESVIPLIHTCHRIDQQIVLIKPVNKLTTN